MVPHICNRPLFVYIGGIVGVFNREVFLVSVDELIEFLQKEIRDEKIIFLLPDGTEMVLSSKPPRHGGPKRFIDEDGNDIRKSTVLVWLDEYK